MQKKADRRGQGSSTALLIERIATRAPERRAFRERRATPRLGGDVSFQVGRTAAGETLKTHDLSPFGLSSADVPAPKAGARLTIWLQLPDAPNQPVRLDALVLGPLNGQSGARLLFVKPPIEVVRRIHRLLR
jgi:hypothetical protein